MNLQAASVVINLDLPWNPARLEQRIARAWRKHQTRTVQVINLVTQDSIEHRMLNVLAGKQTLADGVLDGRGDLDALPMPSGRKAFMARLEQVLGTPVAARPAEREEPAPPPCLEPAERLRQDLVASLGEGLLLLEKRRGGDGREALLAVVEGPVASPAGAAAREAGAEVLDRATYETILRLAERGLIQLAPGAAEILHRSPALGDPEKHQRQQRLEKARSFLGQGERKIRVAGLLAGSGFAAEALPALAEGLDHSLRGLAHLAGAEVSTDGPFPVASPVAELVIRQTPEAAGAIGLRGRLMTSSSDADLPEGRVQSWVSEGEDLLRLVEEGLGRVALGNR